MRIRRRRKWRKRYYSTVLSVQDEITLSSQITGGWNSGHTYCDKMEYGTSEVEVVFHIETLAPTGHESKKNLAGFIPVVGTFPFIKYVIS